MTTAIRQEYLFDEIMMELEELTSQPHYSKFKEDVHTLKNKTFSPPQHVIVQQHTTEKNAQLQQLLAKLKGISHKTIEEISKSVEDKQFFQTAIIVCHAKNPYQKELWHLLAILPTTTKKIVLLDYDQLLTLQELQQTLDYLENYAAGQAIEHVDFLAASTIESIELSTVQDTNFFELELQQLLVNIHAVDHAQRSEAQEKEKLIEHYTELHVIQLKHLYSNYQDVSLQGNLEKIIQKPANRVAFFEQKLTTYLKQAKSIFDECTTALQIQQANANDAFTKSIQQLWAPIILKHTNKINNAIKTERYLFFSLLFLPIVVLLLVTINSIIGILAEPGQLVGVIAEEVFKTVIKKLLALPSLGLLPLLAAIFGYFVYGLLLYFYAKHRRIRRLKKLTLLFNQSIQDTINVSNQQFVKQLISITADSGDSKELHQFPAIVKFMHERELT